MNQNLQDDEDYLAEEELASVLILEGLGSPQRNDDYFKYDWIL